MSKAKGKPGRGGVFLRKGPNKNAPGIAGAGHVSPRGAALHGAVDTCMKQLNEAC